MRRYTDAMPSTSSGTQSTRCRNSRPNARPSAVTASPAAIMSTSAVAYARRSRSSRFAPKYCAAMTPKPDEKPVATASSRFVSGAHVPTAPSAAEETKLPTMMPSTVVYSCCSSIPPSTGRVNRRIDFQTDPRVRLVCIRAALHFQTICFLTIWEFRGFVNLFPPPPAALRWPPPRRGLRRRRGRPRPLSRAMPPPARCAPRRRRSAG